MRQLRHITLWHRLTLEIDLLSVVIIFGVIGVLTMSAVGMYRGFTAGAQAHDAICIFSDDLKFRQADEAAQIARTEQFLENPTPSFDDPQTLALVKDGLAEDKQAFSDRARLVTSIDDVTDC